MPLWKRYMLARLHKPAGEDGTDLPGSSATEQAMDAIGVSDAPVTRDEQVTDPDASTEQEPAQSEEGAQTEQPYNGRAATLALLDELSGDKPATTDTPAGDKPADKPADAAATPGATTPPVDPAKPAATTDATPAADAEEAELLAGVKSERGRERIRTVFAERKQLEGDIGAFRQMISSTGMNAEEFAQSLEFGRLVNAGDEQSLGRALEMVEAQRTMLYSRLGREAPGVDLLTGHKDLADAVSNLEITRERAVELASHRQRQQTERAQRETAEAHQRGLQEFEGTVNAAAKSMEGYLKTREAEVDHPARMKALGQRFADPKFMQQFVSTYKPEQWGVAVQMLYDGITVPRAAPSPQPLRATPARMGMPQPNVNATGIDRLAARMDAMNL